MTPTPSALDALFVVTHTHWDREWYRTAEEFRPRLVDLVDDVLDGKSGAHVLLDGQAIVLLDYLSQRPERTDDLVRALADGRIDAGPWFVLGDNLMPSGEALVRNLLAGREVLARYGARAPSVLYCPDSFGHPAALPRLAEGFGIPVVVLWRGYGGAPWPAGDTARWRSDDGASVLLHHLPPDGYEFGANLPRDRVAVAARWGRIRDTLAPRATLGIALLLNGADHHAVQDDLPAAIAALASAAAPVRVAGGQLGAFVAELAARAATRRLPQVAGELRRSSEYVWSLQGTFGTRAAQKRRLAQGERLLVHDVEPWVALATWRTGTTRIHESRSLWRTLLACHPHDTLCGCSIDAVAEAMDHRLGEVERAGALAGAGARRRLLGHDASAARDHEAGWRSVVVVRNALPYERGGIAELEVEERLAVVAVGPGSAGPSRPGDAPARVRLGDGRLMTQELSRDLVHVREESPHHYPRNLLVERRRLLAWLPPVEPLGLRVIPLEAGRARPTDAPRPVECTRDALDNGRCRVWVDEARRLHLRTPDGRVVHDVLALEVQGERGDTYTPSPIPATRRHGTIARHRCTVRGALRGELRLTMKALVPARSLDAATGRAIHHSATPVTVTVDVRLDAGSDMVQCIARGTNAAEDARIRLVFRSGIAAPAVWADAAFGVVPRDIAVAGEGPAMGAAREATLPTAPLHRYVSLYGEDRGWTLVSDGLAEYEARTDGSVAVTLIRAVGELSRPDLPERPGHAGWPAATPGAQCRGAFEGRFAILSHAPRTEETRVRVERAAESFLLPLVGEMWHSALEPPTAVTGPRLSGEGLVLTACKPGEDGASLVLRALNLLERPVDGCWQLAGAREAWLARLDEAPLAALPVREGRVEFVAPPRACVTILLRA